MKLYERDGVIFVGIGDKYMLAIGRKEDVVNKPMSEIRQLVEEAIAISQYNDIHISVGRRVH